MKYIFKLGPQSAVLIALLLLSGCAAVGAILYKVTPAGNVPARYAPLKELAVVIVRNTSKPGENEIEAEQLSRLIADQLRAHEVVPLVADNTITDIRDRDPKGYLTASIQSLGRAAGAKQVFYVDLARDSIDAEVGDTMVKGTIDCTLRVVDVATGNNRWPADAVSGIPVGINSPITELSDKVTESLLKQKMHEAIAKRIVQNFYSRSEDDDDLPSTPDLP